VSAVEDLFLPEPDPRPVHYTVISVDDHLVEPPGMFDGRLPRRFRKRTPRVVETRSGYEVWDFDGRRYAQGAALAVAGRRRDTATSEPGRFEHMRRGCWDIHARIRDMDINGVWASMNFPSMITGFCGRVFSQCSDPQLGQAVMRAWNDWLFEEWWSPYPNRIIPLGITWLTDPEIAATEIRRNAARGFRSVALPERPHLLGLPSIFDDYWEPLVRACAETDTVISLHVGSSGMEPLPQGCPVGALSGTMFEMLAIAACAEWLWSGWPLRYPELKVVMSEGGIGWVAMLIDRLDNIVDRSHYGLGWNMRPSEVLRRNFWFCTLGDPSTIDTRRAIGVENIMLETDYPHADGTWPDTQEFIASHWGHISPEELRLMCSENAARLYRHPLPEKVLPPLGADVSP
jgi:predicted TIM-barrel fold metal-dependent hydrolase